MKLNQTLPAVSVYSWLGLGDVAVTRISAACCPLTAPCFAFTSVKGTHVCPMLMGAAPDSRSRYRFIVLLRTVTFKGPVQGKTPASATVRRVDATHANAVPAYIAAGEPDYPNASMLAALRKASAIVEEPVTPVAGADGTWSVTIEMPAYSVATVSF